MELGTAELVRADQEHLIHPLHHPSDHQEPIVYVRGRGATVQDINGREYLDGLSGWMLRDSSRTNASDAISCAVSSSSTRRLTQPASRG